MKVEKVPAPAMVQQLHGNEKLKFVNLVSNGVE